MKLKKLLMLTLIFAGLISHVDTLTRGGGGGHGGGRGYGGRGGYGRGYGGRNWRGYGYGYGGGYWGYPWYGWGWGWPYYGYGWGYPYVGVSYTSSSNDNYDNHKRQSNFDDEGYDYWEIRNTTNEPIYVSAPGSNRIYIAPKKRARLYRKQGFSFRVEGSKHASKFFATSHTVKIMLDEHNHYYLGFYGVERPAQ